MVDDQTGGGSRHCGVCVYTGEALARYGFPNGHPFGPDRLAAFWNHLVSVGLERKITAVAPVMASASDIERFHTHEYVEFVRRQSATGAGFLDGGDTPVFPGVYEAAAYVVGSSLDAASRIMKGQCRRAFVPIGGLHHARRDRAAGFCVFNDCGVLIEALRADFGLRRIAYVDIDAHHGDGVFYAFEYDPHVFIADLHEDGRYLYPGTGRREETGRGDATGTKLNIPLEPYAGDAAFQAAWPEVEAFIRRAAPEFVILQCGADSIAGDPLTHLAYTPAVHRQAAAALCRIADEYCEGRLLALGGGGYDRRNLALAWTEVVASFVATASP